uniref:Uncharacterized protein n=1 Tax=Anopheles maculatus TaxID=74869 RepID=A0A182T664_9DIPT
MMMFKTNLAIVLVTLAVLTRSQVSGAATPVAKEGDDSYSSTGESGGDGSYGGYGEGSYGGYGEGYGEGSYGGYGEGYGEGSYGGYGEGGYGGYGGYGGWNGHKWNDVELYISMRDKLIQAATNAIGFSQLAALNVFNSEALGFPYSFPGKLSLYVRELEKVPPYYKYDHLYKKTSRSDDEELN